MVGVLFWRHERGQRIRWPPGSKEPKECRLGNSVLIVDRFEKEVRPSSRLGKYEIYDSDCSLNIVRIESPSI